MNVGKTIQSIGETDMETQNFKNYPEQMKRRKEEGLEQ